MQERTVQTYYILKRFRDYLISYISYMKVVLISEWFSTLLFRFLFANFVCVVIIVIIEGFQV
jgi:hypothetical protein